MVDINEATVWLPEDKLTALLPALKKLEAGDLHGCKEVTSFLVQWVAKAFPAISSHLQPLYAWEQAGAAGQANLCATSPPHVSSS